MHLQDLRKERLRIRSEQLRDRLHYDMLKKRMRAQRYQEWKEAREAARDLIEGIMLARAQDTIPDMKVLYRASLRSSNRSCMTPRVALAMCF